jgi:cytochrome c-type biogenesis protein CcmE
MQRKAISDWIQILATIGVIVGLVLVAFELRQNANLARADMNSQMLVHQQSLFGAFRDRDFAMVFTKSLERPDALSAEDAIMMNGYYRDLVATLIREWQMIARGVFEDDSMFIAMSVVRSGLGTEYGQERWAQNKHGFGPSLRHQIDQAMEEARKGQLKLFY